MSISLIVSAMAHSVDVEPETRLLWVLQDSGICFRQYLLSRFRTERWERGKDKPGRPHCTNCS
jgi:hypothetical protein